MKGHIYYEVIFGVFSIIWNKKYSILIWEAKVSNIEYCSECNWKLTVPSAESEGTI